MIGGEANREALNLDWKAKEKTKRVLKSSKILKAFLSALLSC
jgi:hypothetical protein